MYRISYIIFLTHHENIYILYLEYKQENVL